MKITKTSQDSLKWKPAPPEFEPLNNRELSPQSLSRMWTCKAGSEWGTNTYRILV